VAIAMPEQQRRDALHRLALEEADAWFEYLASTKDQPDARYREVETWAWARLTQRLRGVTTRRAKVKR
jgi:hypothetical protein